MIRPLVSCSLAALLLLGCGPDKRECSGPHPVFVVVLQLASGPLAPDTVVDVTYGGSGKDQHSLVDPDADHQVIFCYPSKRDACERVDASTNGAAGASGEEPEAVDALCCELWTAGFTHLEVRASGLETTEYDLYPRENECTRKQTIVLDSPDAG